jgi:parvulin-like peptidyl-prolyl isomerase
MIRALVFPASCILAFAACASPASDPILASYAGGEVTLSEYESYGGGRRAASRPPEEKLLEIALTELLADAALANDAASGPVAALRLRGFDDRPWVKALENRVRADSEPSEQEILDYIDARRHQLTKPRKVRLWSIFKRAPRTESAARREAARAEMEEIRRRALAGEDFNELAQAESEGVNRHRGGRMGAIPPGQLKKELDEVAFGLEEGEISLVIAVEEGFVILRNAGWVEATTMSEEEAIGRVRTALRRQAFERAWEQLRAELFDVGGVEFEDSLVSTAVAATPIGRVSGDAVTYGEIDGLARSLSAAQVPSSANALETVRLTDARVRAVFDELAFARLAAERARAEGLAPDPSATAINHHLRNRYLATVELERRGHEQPIEVTDDDATAFFETNPQLFRIPDRSHVRLIQLRLDGDPETLVRKSRLGSETVARIRSGRITFAEAARDVSEHPSAKDGGDIGWKPRRWAAGLGPNVVHALEALEPGEVSDVVRQDHLWILRLEAVEPGRDATLEEALPGARLGATRAELAARKREAELAAREELAASFQILSLPPQAEAVTPPPPSAARED